MNSQRGSGLIPDKPVIDLREELAKRVAIRNSKSLLPLPENRREKEGTLEGKAILYDKETFF